MVYGLLHTQEETVAPFAGAWIEIIGLLHIKEKLSVAPFAGAWIEMRYWILKMGKSAGRSLRGSVD